MVKNETFLKEIRDRYDYHVRSWQDIWDEGNKDMKYLSGDPWDPRERARREKYKRPCLTFDELQQHVNQTVNKLRVNKLAIKITPEGGGATEKQAELRQARIRKIEYDSKAQTAYLRAYEDMISRSYGYFGVLTEYCGECEFDLKIKIRMFPNPNTVSLDPDAKEAAATDMMDAFVIDRIPIAQFKLRYPRAAIKDFTSDHRAMAPRWITDEDVQIAEYWKIEIESRKLLLVEGLGKIFEDELESKGLKLIEGFVEMPDGSRILVNDERSVETRKVKEYLLNGVEILEERDWPGSWIPIFPMFGKEMYVENNGHTERIMLSRVRNARDPFMAYCYTRSTQAELIRMTPKFPYMGYEGQFDTETDWEHINDIPTAYVEVKPITAGSGQTLLPIPERQPYEPALASLELFAESCKRAIQSAFGSYNASVGKEDTHARSGVAIKSLQAQTAQGTFHFVDSDKTALEQAGRCINELLDKIENGPRDVGIMQPDDTAEVRRINEPAIGPDGQEQLHTYGSGNFGIIVSTGPSYQTQREEASDFLDTLVGNLQALPIAPEVKSKLISLAIKLKSLGPIGDEMAKLLDPTQEGMPPQAIAKLKQAQQIIKAMQEQLQQLMQEREARILELESKEKIAATQAEVDKAKIQADVEIALAKIGSNEAMGELKQELALLQTRIDQLSATEEIAPVAG